MRQVGWMGGLALAALVGLGGCGGSGGADTAASSSTEQVQVKGKATYKGKPLAKVEVHFDPVNGYRKSAPTANATTDDTGAYSITTLVGDNTITLGGPTASKDSRLSYFRKTVDLKAGENTVDLDIP